MQLRATSTFENSESGAFQRTGTVFHASDRYGGYLLRKKMAILSTAQTPPGPERNQAIASAPSNQGKVISTPAAPSRARNLAVSPDDGKEQPSQSSRPVQVSRKPTRKKLDLQTGSSQ